MLWSGSPAQWVNFGSFAGAAVAAGLVAVAGWWFAPAWILLVVPVGWAGWAFLVVRCRRFELTTERLRVIWGVFNQHIDEIELYRVKDVLVTRPWWMRLTGLASLHLRTSDRTMPQLEIPAIRDGFGLRELLRKRVEEMRERKLVREMDFDETAGSLGNG